MTLAERYCAIRKAAVTDAFLSSLSQTEEGRASAERIEQTGMV